MAVLTNEERKFWHHDGKRCTVTHTSENRLIPKKVYEMGFKSSPADQSETLKSLHYKKEIKHNFSKIKTDIIWILRDELTSILLNF